MTNFTMQSIKAAALLLFAAAFTTVQAAGPKRIVKAKQADRPVAVEKVKPAFAPTPLKQRPNRVVMDNRDILVDEDFSAFTSGSLSEPDTLNILASSMGEPGIYIDPSLTKDGTWAGDYVYSAGGAALIKSPSLTAMAYLMTPLGDYSGEITVTCKVRAVESYVPINYDYETGEYIYGFKNSATLNIFAGKGGFSSDTYANTDNTQYSLNLFTNTGWTEVTYTFNNYDADNDGYICIWTVGALLVDDVKVTAKATFLASPKVIGVTDFQPDNFTIEWQSVRKAQNYYLDLYEKVYTSDTDGAMSEDFENYSAPQEGWTITSADITPDQGAEGSKAVMLGAGDTLATAENGATYKTADMYIKFVTPGDPMMSWAYVYLDGKTEEGWESFAMFYAMSFSTGDVLRLADESEGFANKYTAIRLRPVELSEGESIVVDDIDITTNRPSKLERVWGENSMDAEEWYGPDYVYYDYTDDWTQLSYTFPDLDPETEYYYAVRSHNMDLFSDGVIRHAFAVSAPEALPATEVDKAGSFTANWNAAPKATGYTVKLYGVATAEEDTEDFVVLEENFDKVDSGVTAATDWASPDALGNTEETSLDGYTQYPGWTGQGNTVAQGMLGGESRYNYSVSVTTPEIYVGNGDELKIDLTAYGQAGDYMVFNVGGELYYVQFDTAADGTGVLDGWFTLPVSSESVRIRMSTLNYGAFMIDNICFMQDVRKGGIVKTALASADTGAETTSYTFTDIAGYGFGTYGYDVTSSFELEGKSTVSVPSDLVTVDLETGESEVTTGIEDATQGEAVSVVARYSLDGRLLTAPQRGVNILKMSDGTTRKVVVK